MSLGLTVHTGTKRKLRGSGSLLFFTVSASAPMTVLAGGILATYAVSGNTGVPLTAVQRSIIRVSPSAAGPQTALRIFPEPLPAP